MMMSRKVIFTKLILRIYSSSNKCEYSSIRLCRCFPLMNHNLQISTNTSCRNMRKFTDLKDDDEVYQIDFETCMSLQQFTKNTVLKKLQAEFQCSYHVAESMLRDCNELLMITPKHLHNIAKYYEENGFSKDLMSKNPWLLMYKPQAVKLRLEAVKQLDLDIVNTLPLLSLQYSQLLEICKWAKKDHSVLSEGNRINYLSTILQCSTLDMCQVLANHQFLQTIPFERLIEASQAMLDCGVLAKNILRDAWVFRYSIKLINERLQMAKRIGIQNIKPWMVRCPDKVFARTLQRHVDRKTLLGKHPSVLEYLSQRLACSLDCIQHICHRHPALLKVNVPKIKEILDFLLEEGFSEQQVQQVPRILCHSFATIQLRLAHLRGMGYNPSSLIVLCKSKQQYAEFVQKWQDRTRRFSTM